MKTITLTMNEVLVLIAEGMTMNNVKTLANKLRNADAPVATLSTEKYDLEKAKAQSKTWEQSYHDAMINLDKAKQTESVLRAEISNLENYVKQDTESLKYFRKWVEELRVATGYSEGVTPATVFSNAIELVRQHMELRKRVDDRESKLVKVNDVIATVKTAYDSDEFDDDKISLIASVVEAYYRGN